MLPEQYLPKRLLADDVQELLRRVEIHPAPELTRRFPAQHSARVQLHLRDGRNLKREQHDYEGFHTRPMSWGSVQDKFDRLATSPDSALRTQIVEAIRGPDDIGVDEVMRLLMTGRPSDERDNR